MNWGEKIDAIDRGRKALLSIRDGKKLKGDFTQANSIWLLARITDELLDVTSI